MLAHEQNRLLNFNHVSTFFEPKTAREAPASVLDRVAELSPDSFNPFCSKTPLTLVRIQRFRIRVNTELRNTNTASSFGLLSLDGGYDMSK